MRIHKAAFALVLAASTSVGQTGAAGTGQAPAQSAPETNASTVLGPKTPDRSAAYYHYTLAHMYEELVSIYQSSEFANKAIEEYRLAIENDPSSEYLNSGLAELYAKTGRIRDAVMEAQEIIKRDPNNLEARKLLGRIYLRGLGDLQSGAQSQEILKRAIEQYEQIARIEPKSIDNHILLGRLYRLNNDLLKAENEFKTAVSLQPDSEEAVTMLAYLYNDEGDSKRAAEVLTAIPEAQRTTKLYSALGYTYEQQHEYGKAVEAYRAAVKLDKDNLEARRGLAQNLLNDNQHDAALEQFRTIVDADPHDAQSHLRIAELYRRTGNFDKAIEALKRAEAEVQDSLEVPYNMAVIYQAQGKYDEATRVLQNLLKKTEKADGNYTAGEKNNRSVFLERLGSLYRDQGKTAPAVETFRRMLDLGNESAVRAYQQLIDTYRDAKDWKAATATAQEAVEKIPSDRNLKLVLAGQLADMGESDAALEKAKSLLKGTPEDREVYIALAQMYSRLRRWPDAEQSISKALEFSTKPDEKEYVNFILASIYERQKKYDMAEETFRKVLANDPDNAVALNYLGYMLADRGVRLEEALNYIKKALQLDPQNGAYLDSLGWAYFKMGNYDLAEVNLRKAVEKVNNDPTVLDHLGDLYQKTDRLKLAAATWERALQEWNKTIPAEVEQSDVAKVQKKLDAARVRLAKDSSAAPVSKQ
ncbi:MAG TPA: tetratricopeptide repeat protein [Terriglobales bacterium]|nr:tetratricopeptide repeat protein [Terriglobales bacterium]